MVKFESPEIDVVMFSKEIIMTDSSGYGNINEGDHSDLRTIIGGDDGDFPL